MLVIISNVCSLHHTSQALDSEKHSSNDSYFTPGLNEV